MANSDVVVSNTAALITTAIASITAGTFICKQCRSIPSFLPPRLQPLFYEILSCIIAIGCVFYEMLIFGDEGQSMFAETNP